MVLPKGGRIPGIPTRSGDAFDIAVEHGFTGTRAEWLASLVGANGEPGPGLYYKGIVASVGDLPAEGNTVSDAYTLLNTTTLYAWDGTAWIELGDIQGPGAAGVTEIENPGDISWGLVHNDGRLAFGGKADGTLIDYSIAKVEGQLISRGNLGGGAVSSVNGQDGVVVLDAADVGALPDTTVVGGDANLFAPQAYTGFAKTGSDWDASTYAAWIAGIDTALGGAATKTSIGTSGAQTIWAYTAGSATAPHALVVSGTHPDEMIAMYSAMRFFLGFAGSSDPAMQALRARLRVTWVPCLGAAGYGSSHSGADGTNINRNFAFFWDYYTGGKGAAPYSTAEATVVKSMVDGSPIGAVLDCHVSGDTGGLGAVTWGGHGGFATGSTDIAATAMSVWQTTYNTNARSAGEYDLVYGDAVTQPSLARWASKYLRWDLGRANALGVTIECNPAKVDAPAGTGYTYPTASDEMATLYAGYLHMVLVTWLTQGQRPTALMPSTWPAMHTTGQTITTTATPITLNAQPWLIPTSSPRAWIDAPMRAPGVWEADISLMVQASATASGSTRVAVSIGWAKTPPAGGNLTPLTDHTRGWIDIPAASGYSAYHRTLRLSPSFGFPDANPLQRLQVFVQRVVGDADPQLLSATVVLRHVPNDEINPTPYVRMDT